MNDFLIRGGTIVDGSGAPGFEGDVAIEGDRVVDVCRGHSAAGARREIDARGRVVAPGFIDPHTHYDAQILWDPRLTPSSWHGVTTVVTGNCGFGIAPVREEHHEILLRTLENVEGMSFAALEAGVAWDFTSFASYLDSIERRRSALNVGVLVGHTPLRLHVLGTESVERAARPDEIEAMAGLLRAAMAAGAIGFATSASPTHVGFGGKPVPSRLSEFDEVEALVRVLAEERRGIVEVTPGPGLFMRELGELSRDSGRPVTWAALLSGMGGGDFCFQVLDMIRGFHAEDVAVWPQVSCRPLLFEFNLREPTIFETLSAFQRLSGASDDVRRAAYADPAFREEVKQSLGNAVLLAPAIGRTEIIATKRHGALRDRELGAVAEERGVDVLDLILDLGLAENLDTQFRTALLNTDEDAVGRLLASDDTILGLSDAGAHAGQLCDACYSTHLLGHWVRDKKVLSLERAIRMLTSQPADLFGIAGRGRLQRGAYADVVVFDPATVAALPLERVRDLPAGAERLISRARGIEHVLVNGRAIIGGEASADELPGRLLRHGGRA
jgi:N-acyl-D-aspartate/D-glutamate deacylase